jgi:hypothetical protein
MMHMVSFDLPVLLTCLNRAYFAIGTIIQEWK